MPSLSECSHFTRNRKARERIVTVRNTTLRECRRGAASSQAAFGAFLDRLQPHSPGQGASGIDHPPVLPKLAARRWVGSKHTCLRCNHASVRSRSEEHTSELQSLRHLVCRL